MLVLRRKSLKIKYFMQDYGRDLEEKLFSYLYEDDWREVIEELSRYQERRRWLWKRTRTGLQTSILLTDGNIGSLSDYHKTRLRQHRQAGNDFQGRRISGEDLHTRQNGLVICAGER